jgi:hypothetical protein
MSRMNEKFQVSLRSFGDPFTGLDRFGQGEKDGQGMASEGRFGALLMMVDRNKTGACRSRGKQKSINSNKNGRLL